MSQGKVNSRQFVDKNFFRFEILIQVILSVSASIIVNKIPHNALVLKLPKNFKTLDFEMAYINTRITGVVISPWVCFCFQLRIKFFH